MTNNNNSNSNNNYNNKMTYKKGTGQTNTIHLWYIQEQIDLQYWFFFFSLIINTIDK